MSPRTIIVVILALICGGAAAVGVAQLRKPAAPGIVDTAPVLVANIDVPRGNVLGTEQLKIEQWPKDHVPEGTLSTVDEAAGRTVTLRLVKGEPIFQRKLAAKDAGRGLAAMIPPGMRAFTILAAHTSAGVGGFVLPGNHVDVLLTTEGTGGAATTTLLQNVQILAVAQMLDAPDTNKVDPSEFRNVTLLVTPNQAAKLDLGMNKGILHLSLRNPEDIAQADTRPATLEQLRFHQEDALPSGEFLMNTFGNVARIVSAASMVRVPPAEKDIVQPPVVAKKREARIQTLRGLNQGLVRIQLTN